MSLIMSMLKLISLLMNRIRILKISNHETEQCFGGIIKENHFNKNSQFSENAKFVVSSHPVQGNKSFSAVSIHHNSVKLVDP